MLLSGLRRQYSVVPFFYMSGVSAGARPRSTVEFGGSDLSPRGQGGTISGLYVRRRRALRPLRVLRRRTSKASAGGALEGFAGRCLVAVRPWQLGFAVNTLCLSS